MYFKDINENGQRAVAAMEAPVAEAVGANAEELEALRLAVAKQRAMIEALMAERQALLAERQNQNFGMRRLEEHEPIMFVIERKA